VAETFRIRLSPAMLDAIATPTIPSHASSCPRRRNGSSAPKRWQTRSATRRTLAAPGLTHRYPDRAILHVTQARGVLSASVSAAKPWGRPVPLPESDLAAALAYVARTPALREVILTGGDPLSCRRAGWATSSAALPPSRILR
jgi:lysine 2,3-aminomutase